MIVIALIILLVDALLWAIEFALEADLKLDEMISNSEVKEDFNHGHCAFCKSLQQCLLAVPKWIVKEVMQWIDDYNTVMKGNGSKWNRK